MGKIPLQTGDNCSETPERKRTQPYNALIDLLIGLAMESENDSHMDKYLRNYVRRETLAERNLGKRSSQPNGNHGKGGRGQLKHMQLTPPTSDAKGVPNLFCYRPVDEKGGPCHAHDFDRRASCLLQLHHKQKTKDG